MVIKETPLPPVGEMSSEQHTLVSRKFIREHFPREKRNDNRLQASEKVWGSVSHALIAVGKRRGWIVGEHNIQLQDVAIQLRAELDEANSTRKAGRRGRRKGVKRTSKQDEFLARFKVARSMHSNFYQNHDDFDAIDPARRNAETFIKELEALLNRKPTAYTPRVSEDQQRLARLLGFSTRDLTPAQLNEMFRLGKADPNGFSPEYGYKRPLLPDDDDEGNGEGVPNPDPPADGGQSGGATINGGTNLQRREGGLSSNAGEHPGKPGPKNRKSRRKEPQAAAAVAAQSSRPGKEQRQVIKPRPAAQRQSSRR